MELIRRRESELALEYAQIHLATAAMHADRDKLMIDRLERAMALLAFDDPSQSPFSDLLLESQRYKVRCDCYITLCRLRGCKNRPAPFPGRMSYKATKPGLVFVLFLSML